MPTGQQTSSLSVTNLTALGNQSPRLGSLTGLWMQSDRRIRWQAGQPQQGCVHIPRGSSLPHGPYGGVPLYLRFVRQPLGRPCPPFITFCCMNVAASTSFAERVLGSFSRMNYHASRATALTRETLACRYFNDYAWDTLLPEYKSWQIAIS